MSISLHAIALSLLTTLVLLSGCAVKSVSDSDRDTTRSFDGNWRVSVQKSTGIQYVEKWQFQCDVDPFEFYIHVVEGKAYLDGVGSSGRQVTNVGKNGNFTFIVPLEGKATASIRSAETIANGDLRVQLTGNLSEYGLSGWYTVGVKQFAWRGCRTKFLIKKSPRAKYLVFNFSPGRMVKQAYVQPVLKNLNESVLEVENINSITTIDDSYHSSFLGKV